jgi:hypothetical protein
VDDRDPGPRRPARPDGRPAFGLGPIARVPTVAAMARPTSASYAMSPPAAGGPGVPVIDARARAGRSGTLERPGANIARARAFGLPNLRRNVCPHFYMTGARGAIPIHAPHLLKALVRQNATTSRCQLRGGVHLEQGYVNDVCLSPRFNQCVFYEEELTSR